MAVLAFAGNTYPTTYLSGAVSWHGLVCGHEGSMPRVDDSLQRGIAFMYPTRQEAERRVRLGGSAFVVGVTIPGSEHVRGGACVPYLISNRHVVFSGGASVASINRRDGGRPAIFEYEPTDWTVHPDGDDVAAICLFGDLDSAVHEISFIYDWALLDQKAIQHFEVGMGDEVFMIGRFLNHQGRTINRPAIRFGSLSMMPEPIWNAAINKDQLSYAVEMRSRTGFSGSPVALYRTPATILTDMPEGKQSLWGLLGVNWGYIYDAEDENGHRENTWLNGVVPAWKILETLEVPKLKDRQKELEDNFHKQFAKSGAAEPSFAGPTPSPDNPTDHKERFNRLLGAAVKRPKSSGQT